MLNGFTALLQRKLNSGKKIDRATSATVSMKKHFSNEKARMRGLFNRRYRPVFY
jgi:hypothetical protein